MEEKFGQQPANLVKVVLFGPESTGKTTLSQQLAQHYATAWVPEYAREYLQDKWNREQKTCEPKDLLPIAEGQMRLENRLAKTAKKLLVCDTDLLETKVYSEAYYLGSCDPILEKYALQNHYDLYFLTYIDVPWEADDLRDKPRERERMFTYFKDTLERYHRNFVILRGNKEERLATAVHHIDKLLKMKKFTEKDQEQLRQKGIAAATVAAQLNTFKEGIPFVQLEKAAVIGDGIQKFSKEDAQQKINLFKERAEGLSLLKFVPASGAASRMFKALFNFLEGFDPTTETLETYLDRTGDKAMGVFANGLQQFPFYDAVMQRLPDHFDSQGQKVHAFVHELLSEEGLNYGFYPKGLLPFHKYGDIGATPFEEHLKEAALYASAKGHAQLHFTISEQHEAMFRAEHKKVGNRVSKANSTEFHVSYSFQKPSTDTVAVDLENQPFRNADGSMLFRPGGHGALIENLNEQDADIIFIKNIDNVAVLQDAEAVAQSKRLLAGVLLEAQETAFAHAAQLERGEWDGALLDRVATFLQEALNVRLGTAFTEADTETKVARLKEKLHRPIRVCGMVRNEGEPGGGPFWIQGADGAISLQIVESAQIDMDRDDQAAIVAKATHFNPVDLVCGVRDHKGNKYDLSQFVDPKQGFITEKTKEGRALKALELPGLWNGAMAHWNTIFVEVPLVTFNPVKTVNDLLKPSHQV
ncbi:DUF4301 family protein [Maribacter sp. 2307ULW6-5]|uniref:DUF4301 family protein n=1 Tax=Maribacter sp. 2307ULW6-5 TaxID=3386275 RepID=UPI0039BCE1F2